MDGPHAPQTQPAAVSTLGSVELRRVCLLAALITLASIVAALASMPLLTGIFAGLTAYLVFTEDLACLGIAALVLWAIARFPLPRRLADAAEAARRHPGPVAAAFAAIAVGITAVGAFHGIGGFDLTRDEMMADFDATIFRTGRLIAPIAAAWRPYHAALEPLFMLPVRPDAGWVSAYLPGNAAFRTLVSLFVDPAWSGPILVAVAAGALFGIARRLWPGRRVTAVVCLALFAVCPQVLLMGMTSYAMTIHLAVNLVWLWLVLRDDRIGHGGAMLVGFVGCGLHQLIFHPLFVAPFLLHLWQRRQHRLVLAYAAAYAVSCVFWIEYWSLMLWLSGHPGAAVGDTYFLHRVDVLLQALSYRALFPTILNLVRFLSWEHLFALPLLLAAWPAIARGEGIARPLAAGLGLTVIAMLVLLPYQAHGWGYRYLHGLIGNVCLLGGYGWNALTEGRRDRDSRLALAALAAATAATLLIILPLKWSIATAFVRPYRLSEAAIETAPADVVLVDWSYLLFAGDLVRNDPFLRNTPKVMDLADLDAAQLGSLCARYRVAVFDRRQARAFGMHQILSPAGFSASLAQNRAVLRRLHCGVPVPVIAPQASP